MKRIPFVLAAVVMTSLPALAGEFAWGPRVGVASDPDQFIAGVHFDFGQFAKGWRFVPNVQLGIGDDVTTLEGTFPVHYLFQGASTSFTPYAGGGLAVAWFDLDTPNDQGDSSEVELGVKATGGMEWKLSGGTRFAVELNLGIGDIHDFQAVAAWTF